VRTTWRFPAVCIQGDESLDHGVPGAARQHPPAGGEDQRPALRQQGHRILLQQVRQLTYTFIKDWLLFSMRIRSINAPRVVWKFCEAHKRFSVNFQTSIREFLLYNCICAQKTLSITYLHFFLIFWIFSSTLNSQYYKKY